MVFPFTVNEGRLIRILFCWLNETPSVAQPQHNHEHFVAQSDLVWIWCESTFSWAAVLSSYLVLFWHVVCAAVLLCACLSFYYLLISHPLVSPWQHSIGDQETCTEIQRDECQCHNQSQQSVIYMWFYFVAKFNVKFNENKIVNLLIHRGIWLRAWNQQLRRCCIFLLS